ncbi:beta-glucanase (GH16 family) [Cellulosimicrobium cellulans]|uniref:Licheninase n=1 Tax=Cellulosimicrobium cellulans TaxID=1710 RepID=A0A1Y0HSQ2_CELCE|nr:discoidin domain-containing protein [Cellulosimicrobium cellulans]ARU51149.1 licheninase [Cellulosimicrobium cellulans]MBM7817526.1 beta-glucanase (GH16 family) [Cellulosimicrobium cellulans]
MRTAPRGTRSTSSSTSRRPSPRSRGRALAAATTAVGLLALGALTQAPATAAPGDPLSQGRTATSSATEFDWSTASAAVDGDRGTRWSSAHADGAWIQVDLGAVHDLDRVELDWETAYASGYRVEVSTDGAAWATAYSTTNGQGGDETLPLDVAARYVRLTATQRATVWGVSLWELQVFGDEDGTGGPGGPGDPEPGTAGLLSYGKQGSASSSQTLDPNCWDCTPDKAFDLDPASRWATSPDTGWVDEGWIAVDLGAPAHVSRVVLQWDPAFATGYSIEVSDDGSSWRSVFSTTTGSGFKETIPLDADGRHVRVHMNDRSSAYGYSLWEFQVYGTGGAPTAPPAQPADPDFDDLDLVWSDEFDAPAGTPADAAKWHVDPGMPQNAEHQVYTASGNGFHDGQGHFVLEARRENVEGREYTSHRMNTSTALNTQYGRFEARIKIPAGQGLWPAFWMMGSDFLEGRPWPYNGEIDIMENVGFEPTITHSTLHAPAYWGAGGHGGPATLPGNARFADDFHVWAAEWDSEGIQFSLDGRDTFYASKETVESTRGPWVYDHEFYLILNLAVGGDWPGAPDASTPFPSRMLVDYVRVYR